MHQIRCRRTPRGFGCRAEIAIQRAESSDDLRVSWLGSHALDGWDQEFVHVLVSLAAAGNSSGEDS